MREQCSIVVGALWVPVDLLDCNEDCVTEASIVLIVQIDDCLLRDKELRELLIGATHQWKLLASFIVQSEDVGENQTRIVPDEVGVAQKNRLHHLVQILSYYFKT